MPITKKQFEKGEFPILSSYTYLPFTNKNTKRYKILVFFIDNQKKAFRMEEIFSYCKKNGIDTSYEGVRAQVFYLKRKGILLHKRPYYIINPKNKIVKKILNEKR